MGEGMVYKLIEANHKLFVKKNKNPNPINRVKKKGAVELKTIKEIVKKCEIIILCLPNSSVAKKIILEIGQTCSKKKLVIDCTTNNYNSAYNEVFRSQLETDLKANTPFNPDNK